MSLFYKRDLIHTCVNRNNYSPEISRKNQKTSYNSLKISEYQELCCWGYLILFMSSHSREKVVFLSLLFYVLQTKQINTNFWNSKVIEIFCFSERPCRIIASDNNLILNNFHRSAFISCHKLQRSKHKWQLAKNI